MNALSKGLLGLGAMPLTLLGSFAVFPVFDAPSQGLYAGIPEISVSPAPVPPRAHPGR